MDKGSSCCTVVEDEVDVIIPVHNASSTLRETVASAMYQIWFPANEEAPTPPVVYVCCYDDGSTDDSWDILRELQREYGEKRKNGAEVEKAEELHQVVDAPSDPPLPPSTIQLESHLMIASGSPSLGAGPARNRAAALRRGAYLCWLDSDDTMDPTRIYHQRCYFAQQPPSNAARLLLGTRIRREPPSATPHYTHWANHLTDERRFLERFREVTVLQPTWMLPRPWFETVLHGYNENGRCPHATPRRLVVPSDCSTNTLRYAEDLRLLLEHVQFHHGTLACCPQTLVTYRHSSTSQSTQTSRSLLLALRARAWEWTVLGEEDRSSSSFGGGGVFVVWGAGRDAKDVVKKWTRETQRRIYCMVDVDDAKIARGWYECGTSSSELVGCCDACKKASTATHDDNNNRTTTAPVRIPIVHWSVLIPGKDGDQAYMAWKEGADDAVVVGHFGHMEKKKPPTTAKKKRPRPSSPRSDPGLSGLSRDTLQKLPVVVCVAMYRTNGALEANVQRIQRVEGETLWHLV